MERDRVDNVVMGVIVLGESVCSDVPDFDLAICASRGDLVPVWFERDCIDCSDMIAVDLDTVTSD
jgi:hypothetical protein